MDEQRKSESELVPALRFEGFTDPWEQRKLGEVVDVHNGKDYKHLKPGSIPVYGTGGLMTYVDDALSKNEDAVGVGRKGTIDQPYKLRAPFWTVDTLFYAVPKAGNDIEFVLCCFQRINWKAKDESTGLPSLSKSAINNTRLLTPRSGEQVRIGALFAKIDSLIALHQRKYEKLKTVKQSLLEKMFPKEGEDVPELRFEGFTDPWEQRKLGEIAHRVTRKNEEGASDLPLTISAQHGLVDQRDFFGSQVASRDMRGYYLLEKGEFAYNKSTSGDSPWGAVKRLARYEKGCLSTLYICFGLDVGDPSFLVTYYETNRWHKGIRLIAAEGARNHGLLNIAPRDFFETELTLPGEIEEQSRIGALFARLDSLIALHQRELEILKNLKKALLEKMFV